MNIKNTNSQLAHDTILFCLKSGVEHFVVCAGARNAPFVKLIGATKKLSVSYFYDERAAGFFALGRAKRDQRPVAVITTSGTAAAELLPSAVEAYYSGHPLVFITADRPKSFRGTGSPQSINQFNIFGEYAQPTLDLDDASICPDIWTTWNNNLHINVCFSEPLLESEIMAIKDMNRYDFQFPMYMTEMNWDQCLQNIKKPIFLISTLNSDEQNFVMDLLSSFENLSQHRFYIEATSGLHGTQFTANREILKTTDFKKIKYPLDYDAVIRIGGVPTIRFWRELESSLKNVPVISFSRLLFSGLGRPTAGVYSLNQLAIFLARTNLQPIKKHHNENSIMSLIEKYPRSEPALLWSYIHHLQSNNDNTQNDVFVGNSLPIRELDLFTKRLSKNISVTANRGANGIDGLISTALGLASPQKNMHVILGDLSALYDLNALSQIIHAESAHFSVVVINNQGGKIFKRMFHDPNFENQHEWRFKNWAEMFGFDYLAVYEYADLISYSEKIFGRIGKTSSETSFKKSYEKCVIELLPNHDETELFWQEYEEI